jgi:hypothetical protein
MKWNNKKRQTASGRFASFFGIIVLVAVIGFTMAACSSAPSTSSNSGSTTVGGDKRADLVGYWEVGGAYYPTSFNLEEVGNGDYLLEMTGGGGNESYILLVSYDGNTTVVELDGETITFTAKIQGNKLTISDWNSNYNGTYTKQE